jgi:aminopeptidase N
MVLFLFQPVACRQAFPCWDEPNFKATFDITLITPKNLRAISNMVHVYQKIKYRHLYCYVAFSFLLAD